MQRIGLIILIVFGLISCKKVTKSTANMIEQDKFSKIKYATGFEIVPLEEGSMIIIKNAWPGTNKTFNYAVIQRGATVSNPENYDAIIESPIESIVVTSTTHIPSLDMLGVSNTLIGFPNLDYISSETIRERIEKGYIKELGKNETINTEVLIEINPDLVVGFAVEGANSTMSTIKKTGIPVFYNADWTENTPLGKAEWIKFFGIIYNKQKEADSIFSMIEANYKKAKGIAQRSNHFPTVISGAMYKDIWYMPYGNSWAGEFIKDSNGNYIWEESIGTGSLPLNIETVLEKGQNAEFWIGPGQYSSLEQLENAHPIYSRFKAFQNDQVYSFTNKKGTTGGILYYELGPNRPDIVLKDLIKIIHPGLLPEHQLFFFGKLE
jgi:iron complex transport system substrate-binding protein